MYAILDVETTGGNPKTEKITELAIFIHDGTRIIDEFSTLVNPEKKIPPFITGITGINNEMVARAPKFYEIAKKVIDLTKDTYFVAHNAGFDYGFICEEYRQLGYLFKREKLCTVKISRKLIPGLSSYSLGNLCAAVNIPIENRHRAKGDALATVRLFEILLDLYSAEHPLCRNMFKSI
jgi:DNA polymerase III subunit epsilon